MRPNKLKAIAEANKALDKHYIDYPAFDDLEGILGCEGLIYQEKPLKSALGFLQRSKTMGTVIISNSVFNSHRKRFIIAHELGHWYLHEDIPVFNLSLIHI